MSGWAGLAHGQANFAESFDGVGDGEGQGGPAALVSRGWLFRNQSRPSGTGLSPHWSEFAGWGQSASALGHGSFATWQNASSRVSAWIILPAVPNQVAGDPLSVWVSAPTDVFGNNRATLEIRYAPSGTSTGGGENDVGSFTSLLRTVSGAGGVPWTRQLVTLPGNGRIAFRLVMGPGSTNEAFNGAFMLDSLQVGDPPAAPYPMPRAGETVRWTLAHSPVVISRDGSGQHPRIPAGGTVIVDPGVQIRFASGSRLDVAGTVRLTGTEPAPVGLRGPGFMRIERGGLCEGSFVDGQAFTDLVYGGKASFTDSAFSDPSNPTGFSYDGAGDIGHRFFDGNLDYARQVLSLTRCTFGQGCEVALLRGWLAARHCTFTRGAKVTNDPGPGGGEAIFVVGNSILSDVTANEAFIDLSQDKTQHRRLDNVRVHSVPENAGIRLGGGGNYLITDVDLSGNRWPVKMTNNSAGILPGSSLPATGNTLNEIPTGEDPSPLDENVVWADAGVPYVVAQDGALRGRITILPGVTVKMLPDAVFFFDTDSNGLAMPTFLGEPQRPVRFLPYTPGTRWYSIVVGGTSSFGGRWDWCEFEGGRFGVGSAQMPLALDNCTFRNNIRSLYSETLVALRKCTFQDNVFSYSGERFAPNHTVMGFLDANHPTNPNSFINNRGNPNPDFFGSFLADGGLIARARHNSLEHTDSDVRNNWWGTATGPREARNPGGSGDQVLFGPDAGGFIVPFRTQPPTSNPPPVVRFVTQAQTAVPGERVHVQWSARDDGSIVTQRVYYSPDSNWDESMELLAEVPAGDRSFEWTVPAVGTLQNNPDQFFRVVAVDDLGQEGIADVALKVTNPEPFTGTLTPTPAQPALVRPGDSLQACAAASGVVGSVYVALELDNDESAVALGGGFISNGRACTVLPAQIPDASTDRARLRFDATGSLNQVKSFYGPYFSIRPDPLLGDAAPSVQITSSHAGQAYPGGTPIVVEWAASDDENLHAFDVRASFDGGRRWFIVARDLAGTARSYTWRLPFSGGIADARLRVVAKDARFQNTSAEAGPFSIVAGGGPGDCVGDFNSDGFVDFFDYDAYVGCFETGSCPPGRTADINADEFVDFFDYGAFVEAFEAGC